METIATIALVTHVITGFSALASGLVAILARKRRGLHSRVGLVYFLSMTGVFISGTTLSVLHDIPFLLGVGVFSYYLCFMGYAAAHWKNHTPKWIRVTMISAGLVGAVLLFIQGSLVPIVFGGILLLNLIQDITVLMGWQKLPMGKLSWMFAHASRMGGSYIATVTAFIVVNVHLEAAPWLPWLLPTVVGTALITRWNIRMRRKLKKAA